jgi:hypothetical protein
MEQNTVPSTFQASLKAGLIMGLISIVIIFLIYFIDSSLLASGGFALISMVVFLGLTIIFGRQYRKDLGGFLSFGLAFNFCFQSLVFSGLLTLIGQILLYHVIDPSLPQVLTDLTFENSLKMLELVGQDPDSLPVESIDQIREQSESNFTLAGQIKNFGFALVGSAIIALILAAILKKRDKSLDY